MTAEEAEEKIKEEMPGADVQVVPHDSIITMDFRPQRVRLFVNSLKVVKTPGVG